VNKTELVEAAAQQTDMPKAAINRVLDILIEIIVQSLSQGNEVALPRLGKLFVTARASRAGRDPRTGFPILIAARKVLGFKAGKELRDAVNSVAETEEV